MIIFLVYYKNNSFSCDSNFYIYFFPPHIVKVKHFALLYRFCTLVYGFFSIIFSLTVSKNLLTPKKTICPGGITQKRGGEQNILFKKRATSFGVCSQAPIRAFFIGGRNIIFWISSGAYTPYAPRLHTPLDISLKIVHIFFFYHWFRNMINYLSCLEGYTYKFAVLNNSTR